jgi:chromosomal replication initiator protein
MEQVWQKSLSFIEKRVSPKTFNSWFRPMKFLQEDGDTFYIGVPDRFTRDWINDHGLKDIAQQELSSLLAREIKIVLRVVEMPEHQIENMPDSDQLEESNNIEISIQEKISRSIKNTGLNPRYRFSDFVEGPSNQLVLAACQNVAENPASTYNPLFIYGGAGLGKTHLLNAIGHKIIHNRPSAKIIYVSTETFVNDMINSIRFMTMDQFRNKYREQCDVLLIDDIQFISKKVRTQEEFFHTFNTLYESHRQIVISSDRYPQEIPELEERLRTRFQWGLIADIQIPEIETRIAILHKKAEIEGLDIPQDVALYIASSAKNNVREIEGSLKRLGALASMYGKPITLEFTKDVLKDTLATNTKISIDDVLKVISSFYSIKPSDLKSSRRSRSISRPRQIAMYICRNYLNATYPDIGNHFNKDHSTAIAAIRNVDKMIKTDPSVKDAVDSIKRQLGL